jgi:hypothetical protein
MRFLRPFFVLLAVLAAFLAFDREARAQSCPAGLSVKPFTTAVTRVSNGTTPLPDHPGAVPVNVINYSDCINDESLQFSVGISGISSYNILAWAGSADCASLAARTPATQTCWEVMSPSVMQVNPTILTIKVRDIVAFINAGTSTKPARWSANQPASVCDTAQTSDAASTISLSIFAADGQGNPCGSEDTYGITVDMLAGSVTGTPTASAGDGLIIVNIPGTTDPDIKGFNVYTDPPPTGAATADAATTLPFCDAAPAEPVVDAGDAGDAGDTGVDAATPDTGIAGDDGGDSGNDSGIVSTTPEAGACLTVPINDGGAAASNLSCQSAVLVNGTGGTTTTDEAGVTTTVGGKPTNLPANYLGKAVGIGTTRAIVSGLQNDQTYAVAVAATDAAGNVGPLTVVAACGANTTPDPVSDFWTNYTKDGGLAGGGFCQAEGVGAPAGSAALGGMMIAAMIGMMRRRRRS